MVDRQCRRCEFIIEIPDGGTPDCPACGWDGHEKPTAVDPGVGKVRAATNRAPRRTPASVLGFALVTLGIYLIYHWFVVHKEVDRSLGKAHWGYVYFGAWAVLVGAYAAAIALAMILTTTGASDESLQGIEVLVNAGHSAFFLILLVYLVREGTLLRRALTEQGRSCLGVYAVPITYVAGVAVVVLAAALHPGLAILLILLMPPAASAVLQACVNRYWDTLAATRRPRNKK